MSNPVNLKQVVPYEKQAFPFTTVYVQPFEKQILHLHWHQEWEIIYITKGEATFHIDTYMVSAKAGDILFVNSGVIHTGYAKENSLVEYYALVFHPDLVGHLLSDTSDLELITRYKSGKYTFPLYIKSGDSHYELFAKLVENLIEEYEQKNSGFQMAIKSLLHLLLIDFIRYYPRKTSPSTLGRYDEEIDEKFKQLISYIEENFDKKISLEDVSMIVNLSTYHFCRTFKKVTGKTFVEYLNLYRINIAEKKLLETDDPVTQIAYDVGFGSINYFSQMFKKYKFVSPSKYRKRAEKITAKPEILI